MEKILCEENISKNVDPEEFCSKKNAEIWEVINAGSRN